MAELDIVTIENTCVLHINNAAASLETQSEKYAPSGLMSAAIAAALSDAVLKTSGVQASELARFREHNNRANRLIQAFWGDFKLILRAAGHTERSIHEEAKREAESVSTGRTRRILTDQEVATILAKIKDRPIDVTKSAWFEEIANDHNLNPQTVWKYDKRYANGNPR